MHPRCGRVTLKAVVVVLTLLAGSPVTAPFLTVDLSDPGPAAPGTLLFAHAKSAADDVAAEAVGAERPAAPYVHTRAALPSSSSQVIGRTPSCPPLRL